MLGVLFQKDVSQMLISSFEPLGGHFASELAYRWVENNVQPGRPLCEPPTCLTKEVGARYVAGMRLV